MFSVPFDAGTANLHILTKLTHLNKNDTQQFRRNPGSQPDTLVTATHAIFHTEEKKSAPVAVVGFQFQHSAMYTLFKNITSNVS